MTLSENIKEVLFAIYSFKGYPDQCEKDLLQAFEPLNFITSLFFIIIAFLLYREMKKHKIKKTSYYLSLIFVLSFALGSLLWHSMKNPYSHFIDTISISS